MAIAFSALMVSSYTGYIGGAETLEA